MSSGWKPGVAALCVALALAGCRSKTASPKQQPEPQIQTIDQARDVPPLPISTEAEPGTASRATSPLVDLPFAPAISMDPVDGGKVSIRPDTPVAEFKDRVFYFRSEENRQAFLRNPEKYAAGSLSRY